MAQEPVLNCPKCGSEIKLTDSLAAPLVAATRVQYEEKLARQNDDMQLRENLVRAEREKLSNEKRDMDALVADKMRDERARIVAEESRRAKQAAQLDIAEKSRALSDLQAVLDANTIKLAAAQQAQAEFSRKERQLGDERRELELTIERRVQDGLTEVRLQAQYAAEDAMKLKVIEKEMTIAAMQEQIEGLKRRAEQGSQQAQGEAMELELEKLLREKFPFDEVSPVPKGEFGGDVIHRVQGSSGLILWEFKNTKVWMDVWLQKLRGDQRVAKADIAVIVSTQLPKGVETFDLVDGVWVCHPRSAVPVAMVLRQSLLDISAARQSAEGQQDKAVMVYQYLTGPRFKLRVEAIVEAFSTMQEDLDKERKAIQRQWAKRGEQIERTLTATVGMYGDLQGIAGKPLQEIEGLSMSAIAAPTEG